MRKCPKGNHLLPRMHYKGGAYYRVFRNKWHRLAAGYNDALRKYAELESSSTRWVDLVSLAYEDYTHAHNKGELAATTIKQYRTLRPRIVAGLGDFDPHEITTRDVSKLLELYRTTPNMANRMLSVLRVIFDKGIRTGACDSNPALGVTRYKESKRDRLISDGEYLAIRSCANRQTQLIMDMCYLTAQRIGDVLKMRHDEISPEGIKVTQQKTGKRIVVGMTDEVAEVIREAKKLHKVMCPYLFHPTGKRSPYSYKAIRDSFSRAVKKAGVEHCTLHDIRAKSLTDVDAAGGDAMLLAGHTSQSMTDRYIRDKRTHQVTGPNLRRVIES